MQSEKGSREATLRDGQRWLDQAQGQLQNTQVALNEKEAECRRLTCYLEQAIERAESLQVYEHPHQAIVADDKAQMLPDRKQPLQDV